MNNKIIKIKQRTRQVNCKVSEAEFLLLTKIRQKFNKPMSELIRESLLFYANTYNIK